MKLKKVFLCTLFIMSVLFLVGCNNSLFRQLSGKKIGIYIIKFTYGPTYDSVDFLKIKENVIGAINSNKDMNAISIEKDTLDKYIDYKIKSNREHIFNDLNLDYFITNLPYQINVNIFKGNITKVDVSLKLEYCAYEKKTLEIISTGKVSGLYKTS